MTAFHLLYLFNVFICIAYGLRFNCTRDDCNQLFIYTRAQSNNVRFDCYNAGECDNLVAYHGSNKNLNVYCYGSSSCNGIEVFCGEWDPPGSSYSLADMDNAAICDIHCESDTPYGCVNSLLSCKGSISSCGMWAQSTSHANINGSTVECNIAASATRCSLTCNAECHDSELKCHSGSTGDKCLCQTCNNGNVIQTTGVTYSPTISEVTTTNIPTTDAPTTFDPTTFGPTTFSPTTSTPTTYLPTTFSHTTFTPSTSAPTTFVPTTYLATLNPTTAPAPTTVVPSRAPTALKDGIVADATYTTDDDLNKNLNAGDDYMDRLILAVVICGLIVVLIVVVLIWFMQRRKKQKQKQEMEENIHSNIIGTAGTIELEKTSCSVSTDDAVNNTDFDLNSVVNETAGNQASTTNENDVDEDMYDTNPSTETPQNQTLGEGPTLEGGGEQHDIEDLYSMDDQKDNPTPRTPQYETETGKI